MGSLGAVGDGYAVERGDLGRANDYAPASNITIEGDIIGRRHGRQPGRSQNSEGHVSFYRIDTEQRENEDCWSGEIENEGFKLGKRSIPVDYSARYHNIGSRPVLFIGQPPTQQRNRLDHGCDAVHRVFNRLHSLSRTGNSADNTGLHTTNQMPFPLNRRYGCIGEIGRGHEGFDTILRYGDGRHTRILVSE